MNPFILILGPSGAGKSTIIKRLLDENIQLEYVTPITDRPPRKGEHFKISVSPEEFTKYEENGDFVAVNHYFTYRYGTPRRKVQEILNDNKIPILDMMLSGVPQFHEYKSIIFTIYLKPPTLSDIKMRLDKEKRDPTGQRYKEGSEEFEMLQRIEFKHPNIDAIVQNDNIEITCRKVKEIIDQKVSSF